MFGPAHTDNAIHANPLTTPAHIVPEWYFLALYAILRSIPNKQSGVAAVALVIFTLVHLGWGSTSSKNRCVTVQPLGLWVSGVYAIADALHLFWILGADVLILGWSGSHCTPHAIRIGQLWGAYSFLCFAILPVLLIPGVFMIWILPLLIYIPMLFSPLIRNALIFTTIVSRQSMPSRICWCPSRSGVRRWPCPG